MIEPVVEKSTLLIVDDDPSMCRYLSRVCQRMGYQVLATADAAEAVAKLPSVQLAGVITDLQMPGCDGIEFLRRIADARTDLPVVILSGFDPRVLNTAQRFGCSIGLNIVDKLQKPVSAGALKATLARMSGRSSPGLDAELAAGIENREFVLHFQPKISTQPRDFGRIIGFEGLARWHHPRKGLLPPTEFISLAESTGHIAAMTDSLIDYGLAQLRRWTDFAMQLSLALNVSPVLLQDVTLADRVYEKVTRAGVDPEQLTFEITESSAMADVTRTMEILTRLRLKNFELSIDDFGTGYSSLAKLYDLPFSELKIDRSFVRDVEQREDAKVIVRALVDLARNLSLKSCAEGVETESELGLLVEFGCDRVQGFFTGHPLPAAAVSDWLCEWPSQQSKIQRARTRSISCF